jgi:hypothetical protein
MPETKPAWQPLETIFRFKTYANAESYNLDHPTTPAPVYVETDDQKTWMDPDPTVTGENDKGEPTTEYRCYDGHLGFKKVTMTVKKAKTPNLKPTATGSTNVPGTGKETAVPCVELGPQQQLMQAPPMGIVMVRNLDVPLTSAMGAGIDFTDSQKKLVLDGAQASVDCREMLRQLITK